MAEQFLHSADVVAVFQQMGRERIAKAMARNWPEDAGRSSGILQGALRNLLEPVMAALDAAAGIGR